MSVLIFAETASGALKKPALEAVSYGVDLAKSQNTRAVAAVLGSLTSDEIQKLNTLGVDKIVQISHAALDAFVDRQYASALESIAKAEDSQWVVLSQTYNGRAIAPRLSVRLQAALVSGVTALPTKGANGLHFTRPAYSGKALQELTAETEKVVMTLKANAWPINESPKTAEVSTLDWQPGSFPSIKSLEVKQMTDKVPLTEADVVVSGGRGLKGPENWGIIEELAETLNAATACSKPVSDLDWRPHHEHVGQTGIQIAPNVYIAIGISGAIQHLAGVNASKTIIVINKDAEAPFFKAADYGIVGDAFEVVPALTAAIKKKVHA